MTFREKLADWISGGALSDLLGALRQEEIWRYEDRNRRHELVDQKCKLARDLGCMRGRMAEILEETANVKSGTAQKIHRMAKEALGE